MLEFLLDPDSVYFKDGKLDMNKNGIICAGGLRSALAAKTYKIWDLKVSLLMVDLLLLNKVNLKLFNYLIHPK